jgi:hypothetical protein
MIDTDAYEKMTWETPSDELEDAVENLLAEVKRLRYIVDSIPDEVWKDMKTWEAMKGVIE